MAESEVAQFRQEQQLREQATHLALSGLAAVGTSDIAQFRREQQLREQAAHLALSGLAVVATHESITKRMEKGAQRILALVQEGKHEEAQALLTSNWC